MTPIYDYKGTIKIKYVSFESYSTTKIAIWNQMETMIENCSTTGSRSRNMSSFASGQSEDLDIGFEALIFDDEHRAVMITPSLPLREPSVRHPPLRKRLGAGMTIVASTSPEIKALNLPSTPAFPATRLDFSRSSSSSPCSCSMDESPSTSPHQPKMSRAQSMRERLSFCIDTMDDVIDFPSLPKRHSREELSADRPFYHDNVDDLLRYTIPNKVLYHPDENKENIHPNLIQQKSDKARIILDVHDDDDDLSIATTKTRHVRRKNSHRRISYESLPSPADIGPSLLPFDAETPVRGNVQIRKSNTLYSLTSLEEAVFTYCRPNSEPNSPPCMHACGSQEPALHLSTSFR